LRSSRVRRTNSSCLLISVLMVGILTNEDYGCVNCP
jgi:hypothetical protein